ncbi:hypothetical protein PHISCL_00589 [Aspergillus sclerotialis]|uniref:Uncharacterized protein n=1 Tax=Aspergillus sclerotialis TaxID=2070753 RepID=A0A3A2ZVH3_9EURO|nr:hypothetical protein PHISCL_00589 [Aspergillus sclerotialis]
MAIELVASGSLALKLLRVTPLITTTILLVNRLAQYFALSTFLPPYTSPKQVDHVGAALQHWIQQVVPRVWKGVIGIVLIARVALILNLFVCVEDLAGTNGRLLYGIGLFFSFAHLFVAPKMLKLEKRLMDPQTIPQVTLELLVRWLKINNVRIWVVDVPFWVVGVLATLESCKM